MSKKHKKNSRIIPSPAPKSPTIPGTGFRVNLTPTTIVPAWEKTAKEHGMKSAREAKADGIEVVFSEEAWVKQQLLLYDFSTEVAWHGVAHRTEKGFQIDDVLIYAQQVSGASVTTDQKEYQDWLMGLTDEQFNSLRYQGHSHVNMGVSPSGIDENLYDGIMEQMWNTKDFYLFMIFNKRDEFYVRVYDTEKGIYYTGDDIEYIVEGHEDGFMDFLLEAEEIVKDEPPKVYTPVSAASKGYAKPNPYPQFGDFWDHGYGYSGYGGGLD